MRYVTEFRDPRAAQALSEAIRRRMTKPWTIMEVCGGQTHTIVRFGLDHLWPETLTVVHGPGCPVCVTPIELIDRAVDLASLPGTLLCSFGDMLRVPGSRGSLLDAKAAGGEIRIITSPMDALELARTHPDREVICFAVGFETTAPAFALAVLEARRIGIGNLSLLVAHVLVPPALEAILGAPDNRVQGVLAAGHVCTIAGYEVYEHISRQFDVPIVVTGFEPLDILEGVSMLVGQLEAGTARVENQYARSVRREGNREARAAVEEVYEVTTRAWRGVGVIPESGLRLRPAYEEFDALLRFQGPLERVPAPGQEDEACRSGLVLTGAIKPPDCPSFGGRCTPDRPLGAPMVSSEGACAAYFRYRRGGRGGGSRGKSATEEGGGFPPPCAGAR